MGKIPILLRSLLLLTTSSTRAQPQVYTPQLTPLNSGRPTFYDPSTSIAGKIALEEHVSSTLFPGVFTTPFVNFTNEVNFDLPIYQQDVIPRLQNIDSRIAAMDSANISISVLMFGPDGIQGVFNSTFATYAASFINDEMASIYKHGNYSGRFEFWCNNALQDPVSPAWSWKDVSRCLVG
jgi:2,3-dihydroxybenzoate decarboxylase